MSDGRRIFFYVQHLLGIGHIARASRVADALAEAGFEVTVATGGLPVPGFPSPHLRQVALPPVVASNAGFSGLADAEGRPADETFLAARRDLLLAALAEARPDAVITEAFPFGRRQMRFELLPLIEAVEAMRPRPLLFSSVRDILQENRKPGRDRETADLVLRHFDAVLVHGDSAFVRLEETFPLAAEIAHKTAYTGLVAPPAPPPPEEIFDVIVSAGGGAVGGDLIRAAIGAATQLPADLSWLVLAGPNLPQVEYDALLASAPPQLTIARFRRDFPSLLQGARVSVSQAGYNTVCDLLLSRCRPLLVPFVAGGETEQTVRAEKLSRLGLADLLPERGLDAKTMAAMVKKALERPQHVARPSLDLDGAARTAEIVAQRFAEGRPAVSLAKFQKPVI